MNIKVYYYVSENMKDLFIGDKNFYIRTQHKHYVTH